MGLRTILDDLEPHFEKGGRFETVLPSGPDSIGRRSV